MIKNYKFYENLGLLVTSLTLYYFLFHYVHIGVVVLFIPIGMMLAIKQQSLTLWIRKIIWQWIPSSNKKQFFFNTMNYISLNNKVVYDKIQNIKDKYKLSDDELGVILTKVISDEYLDNNTGFHWNSLTYFCFTQYGEVDDIEVCNVERHYVDAETLTNFLKDDQIWLELDNELFNNFINKTRF